MPARTQPDNGDVVVRPETRDGTVVYVLRTTPGTDQYLLRSREEAVVQAVKFAERHRVQAWWLDDSHQYVPLTHIRTVAPVGGKRERATPGGLRSAG